MTTVWPGAVDSYTTKVDNVTDVLAAHINNPQDAIVALETSLRDTSLMRVKNTSGSTVAANDVGYIDEAGEFKLTTTANLDVAWAVVVEGAANNADIIVTNKGLVTVILNANCSIGDYLYTSTTTKQASVLSYVRPEVFAVAKTANSSGAGGTCEALLLCSSSLRSLFSTNDIYNAVSLTDSDFTSTIATLPGGAVLTYGAISTGDELNLVPVSTSQVAKMVLHNTTRSNDALISNSVAGTNTVTLTANVPGTWQVGDTITIRSPVETGVIGTSYFVELEITGTVIDSMARTISVALAGGDSGAAGEKARIHPYDTDSASSRIGPDNQVAAAFATTMAITTSLINKRFCVLWTSSGANTAAYQLKLTGETVATP
ncbi:MAG: hypothetical protein KAJ73_01095 [Zetaproteobacteria bacterium]|nr:hypothetical protein [Zetaproteobacteria bacterium]